MGSDKRGAAQGKAGAARGPRPVVVTGPGSVNRGFVSVDPERQREPSAEGGGTADAHGKSSQDARTAGVRGAPATGGRAKPRGARGGRAEPDESGEGGSA